MALNRELELAPSDIARDTTTGSRKFVASFRDPEYGAFVVMAAFMASLIVPATSELAFMVAAMATWLVFRAQYKAGLPMFMPKLSRQRDIHEVAPGSSKGGQLAKGTFFLGNDEETGHEIWMTDNQVRTHMLVMGTTGSGKTQFLLSLCFNALMQNSGFIYVDGKADNTLWQSISSMARMCNRQHDLLLINFATGAKDIFGPQAHKMSNTMNPFAVGSSGMLSELVKSLMQTGKSDVWSERANSYVEALMKPLVFLRDNYGFNLDVGMVRDFFDLKRLETMCWADTDRFPGLDAVLDGMKTYLLNLPSYDRNNMHKQIDQVNEQHGFITMQLIRTFNSLAETYGYIMKTPLAEIDFKDVFLNRRILVVMLPAMEKAPPELTNLGRIIVASVKATLAEGLGNKVEGTYKETIESKATNAPSPIEVVLDEYGYYSVEGFAIVPAQSRSIGVSTIFAGQDYPSFEKGSKEEARAILGNTTTKFCGKIEERQTFEVFNGVFGQGYFARAQGWENTSHESMVGGGYRENKGASIEKMDRVSFHDLALQKEGQWTMAFGGRIAKIRSLYIPPTKYPLRVNQFIKIPRPSSTDVTAFRKACGLFDSLMKGTGEPGTPPSSRDINIIQESFQKVSGRGLSPMEEAIHVLSLYDAEESKQFNLLEQMFTGIIDTKGSMSFDGQMPRAQLPQEQTSPRDWSKAVAQVEPVVETRRRSVEEVMDLALPPEVSGEAIAADPVFDGLPQASSGRSTASSAEALPFPDEQSHGSIDDDDDPWGEVETFQPVQDSTAVAGEVAYSDSDTYGGAPPKTRNRIFADDFNAAPIRRMDVYGVDLPVDGDHGPASAQPKVTTLAESASQDREQGLLDRDATFAGIEQIGRKLGSTESEAALAADVVTREIGEATRYPINPPSTKPTLQTFMEVALLLVETLDRYNEALDE
jgi:intracellular multiplication protein IcmO